MSPRRRRRHREVYPPFQPRQNVRGNLSHFNLRRDTLSVGPINDLGSLALSVIQGGNRPGGPRFTVASRGFWTG